MNKIIAEGNNGAERFSIEKIDESMVKIDVDHSCTHIFNGIIPNELLPAMVAIFLDRGNGDILKAIDSMGWTEKYADMLKIKIKFMNHNLA